MSELKNWCFEHTRFVKLTLLVCLPLLVAFTNIFSPNEDSYKVIKVVGNIIVKNTGNQLSQGDVIGSSETIFFKSQDARASVVSKKNGRFVLTANGQNKAEGTSIKNNLLPAMNNISSRAGTILNLLDLQNYCQGSHLVLDQVKVFISPKAFVMNDSSFFFVRYIYKGEKIDKKLSYLSDTLVIDRNQLFTIDNVPVENPEAADVSLFYYSNKKATLISNMQLVFPESKLLKKELSTLLNEIASKSNKEKTEEITSYLNEFYGKPDAENVKQWLKVNMGLAL